MTSIVTLIVIMLSGVMLCHLLQSVISLSDLMLSVVMLSGGIAVSLFQSVIILSHSVTDTVSVTAPLNLELML